MTGLKAQRSPRLEVKVGGAGKLSGNMSNGRIKAVTFSDRMLMLG